jgi:O-antigen ligase
MARVLDTVIFRGLIVVILLTSVPYGSVESWSQAVFQCLVFTLGLLWVLHGFLIKSWKVGSLRLFLPLIALAVFATLQSLSWSQSEVAGSRVVNAISADPFESWVFTLRLSALVLAGLLARRFTYSAARLTVLVHAIIGVALLSSVFGLVRLAVHGDQGLLLPFLRYGRGFAQFLNKNHFSFLAEAAIGLTIGVAAFGRGRRERLLFYGAVVLLLWVAVVLSKSRGGLLAVTVQIVCAALMIINLKRSLPLKSKGKVRLGLTAATVAGLLLMVGGGVIWLGGDQLTTGVETAAAEIGFDSSDLHEGARRTDIWRATWAMAKAHPFAGAGLGGFWAEAPHYHDASGQQSPQQAHNDYLELAASGGLIGIAIFVWFIVVLFQESRRAVQQVHGFQRGAVVGAIIGVAGIAVHSLVDFGLHLTINALVLMLLLSILSLEQLEQRRKMQAHRRAAFN